MFNANDNNINMIERATPTDGTMSLPWLQSTNVNNDYELSNQYAHIYQQHRQDKKWVLFINPEENSIEQLAKTHGVDVSKILMVNYKSAEKSHSKVQLAHIKSALSKGNCSAVILSNTHFAHDEMKQLESAACAGKTHCVILKKRILH